MGARAKAFFSVSAIGLIVFCFWLWRFMPTQGWAEIDFQGGKWNLVAAGWSTLLHAWPILGAGVMLGLGLGIGLLGMLFKAFIDADQRSEIEHLERLVKESREREQQSLVLARKELEREFQNARSLLIIQRSFYRSGACRRTLLDTPRQTPVNGSCRGSCTRSRGQIPLMTDKETALITSVDTSRLLVAHPCRIQTSNDFPTLYL